jgi:SAM-dependent methyltransferase
MPNDRAQQIESVLNDLTGLRSRPTFNQYAVEENIIFFRSIYSLPSYIKWLLTRAHMIEPQKLLELTDFPFERWDITMHKALSSLQKRDFPGLITPLVEKISEMITNHDGETLLILNAGAGAMETEVQIIKRLGAKNAKKIFFIGDDKSEAALGVAKENLRELRDVPVYELDQLDEKKLMKLVGETKKSINIVLCKNDIFALDKAFGVNFFDIVFSSLFLHHLSDAERIRLDTIEEKIAKRVLEYDGYRTWTSFLPQSITAWNNPVFLNASIFSILRYAKKEDIQKRSPRHSFFWTGTYLLELK